MSFSDPRYWLLLALTLLALRYVRSVRVKRGVLLLASVVFYAAWDARFLALLGGLIVINHAAAVTLASADERRARLVVSAAVLFDLGVLGAFKYLGFFAAQADALLSPFGLSVPIPQVVLPLALSYVVFQVIAYVVDVRRGSIPAASLYGVSLLVLFFPHLVAGPILRPGDFLAQLDDEPRVRSTDLDSGVMRFVTGLVKKVLVADHLAPFVDTVLSQPDTYSAGTLRLVMLAYAIQLYMDFSGYSDMAVGSARCMGITLPENFDHPYASLHITEFWRRWHMSLSTWLRTYVYIPLGGNRRGKARQAANLFLTMLAAGLWHGAAWGFVLWGGLHGIALVVHKWWMERVRPALPRVPVAGSVAAWTVTFAFVSVAWVFFRVPDVGEALGLLARAFGAGEQAGVVWWSVAALGYVPAVLALDVAVVRMPYIRLPRTLVSFRGGFALGMALFALFMFWPTQATPFIYFQF